MKPVKINTEAQIYHLRVKPRLEIWGGHDRIENAIGQGMADICYAIDGQQGWLELKVVKAGETLYFQRFQLPWYRARGRHTKGHGPWVLVFSPCGEWLWLYYGPGLTDRAMPRIVRHWVVLSQSELVPICAGSAFSSEVWDTVKAYLVHGLGAKEAHAPA